MELKRIGDPAGAVVTTAEARTWCGLGSDTSEDSNLALIIPAATQDIEDRVRRTMVNTAWRITVDRAEIRPWDPDSDTYATTFDLAVDLPLALVSAVTAVRAYNVDGTQTVITSANYTIDGRDEDATVYVNSGTLPTPLRLHEALEIEVTAGYGATGAAVPGKHKLRVLKLVAYDFEHRGDDPDDWREKVLAECDADRVVRV